MRNAVTLILLLISLNAFAQETKELSNSNSQRWSISFSFGGTMLGPRGDIENAMRRDGFDRTFSFFFLSTNYPRTTVESSWTVNVKHYFKGPFALSVFFGKTDFGSTVGYAGGFATLSIENSAFIIAPVVSINEYKVIEVGIGVGPALYIIKAKETERYSDPEMSVYDQKKIGFVLDFGIRIVGIAGFFADFNFQFRKVGHVEIGPFTSEGLNAIYVLSKTSVNYDHPFFGLRFGRLF